MKRENLDPDWKKPSVTPPIRLQPETGAAVRAADWAVEVFDAPSRMLKFARIALLGIAAIGFSGCHLFDYQSPSTPTTSAPDAVATEYP